MGSFAKAGVRAKATILCFCNVLFIVATIVCGGVWSLFCNAVLNVLSSCVIISWNRELVALL